MPSIKIDSNSSSEQQLTYSGASELPAFNLNSNSDKIFIISRQIYSSLTESTGMSAIRLGEGASLDMVCAGSNCESGQSKSGV